MVLIDDEVKNALLKVFGTDRNMCQASIAKETGIQQSSISRWISGATKHMGDDNWLKIFPYIKEFLPENYIPKDVHGREKLFLTHNYDRGGFINRLNANNFDRSSSDPFETILLKYFKQLPNDDKKLEVITMIQKMTSNKPEV